MNENKMTTELVDLIKKAKNNMQGREFSCELERSFFFAEQLIEDGVIVPPCKVGDKTFLLLEKVTGGFDIVESSCVKITDNGWGKQYSMYINCEEIGNTIEFCLSDFDRYVFLTKEEAEKALKASVNNE